MARGALIASVWSNPSRQHLLLGLAVASGLSFTPPTESQVKIGSLDYRC
jgi:hypothetical protein